MNKNIIIIILLILVLVLSGYILYDNFLLNDKKSEINEEIRENNDVESNDENIPYLDNLIGITYISYSYGEDVFESKINDKDTMKQVLSIFKDKTLVTEEPDGLGGAGYKMLTLEYEDSELEISLVAPGLVEIENQYYNVDYSDDYYVILENIFK